jgi:DnaJ-class molecular chaperone
MNCPNCNGSGVVQEWDEYDRYYLFVCSRCEGTGEIEGGNKDGNEKHN